MRKLLMPILITWALNRLAQRYMQPQGVPNGRAPVRGYNSSFAAEFFGDRLGGQAIPYARFSAAMGAFKKSWKNYRE